MTKSEPFSRFCRAEDGLRLHFLDIAPSDQSARVPAVCLPGLARTTDDFLPLATALAKQSRTPRRVLAFDYRGRGLSDRDPNGDNYNLQTEQSDFLRMLDALGVRHAHFVGTSRGGLHVLALTEARPKIIGATVLNDIGPVLETAGLARIKGYVGKGDAPKSFNEAITLLKGANGCHFDGLSPAEWRHFAETTFGFDENRLEFRYDRALARALDTLDLDKPLPDSWHLFDKLARKPVLTLRGANSDLLSEATLAKMGSRWPECQAMTVPGQGHAPLLADHATISRIDKFLADADEIPA